jgi:transcription initiation factor TFIIB
MHSPLNASDRGFLRNSKELGDLAARLDISDQCVKKAKELFKLACDAGSLKGQKHEAVAAACLFLACRLKQVGRSLNEIVQASGVPKKKINKSYKAITQMLNIRLEAATATNFTGRYTNGLGLDRKVAMLAEHVAKASKEMLIVEGRVPTSTVAAAIYMAVLVKGKGDEVSPARR